MCKDNAREFGAVPIVLAVLGALRELRVRASGRVGSHDPLQAADDGLREFRADEIVFAVRAKELDIDEEKVRGVFAAIAPIVGTARVASAMGKIVRALGLAIELAELEEIEA